MRKRIRLDHVHWIEHWVLPTRLTLDSDAFDSLWNAKPAKHHTIVVRGKTVRVPRWEKAYGRAYRSAGRGN